MPNSIQTITWKFKEPPVTIRKHIKPDTPISCPEQVYISFRKLFENEVKERFVVIWLNAINCVIGYEVVTEGILNSSLVHPREVFRGAIVATSAAIILAHGHPSGNPEPSQEDISITKQIVEAGKIIGIPVYDHIIFVNTSYTSFAERRLI